MDSKEHLHNDSTSEKGNRFKDGNMTLLEKLSNVSLETNAAEADFHWQIGRWNRYQELLDRLDEKCQKTQGDVRLKRNIKHNVKVLTGAELVILSTIGLTALFLMVAGTTMADGLYSIICGIVALAFVGWQVLTRMHPPSIIHFRCRPELHIDEYAYMNRMISKIPKVQRDPVVVLPKLEMSIPRSWLAQQGMLEFMKSLDLESIEQYRSEIESQEQEQVTNYAHSRGQAEK